MITIDPACLVPESRPDRWRPPLLRAAWDGWRRRNDRDCESHVLSSARSCVAQLRSPLLRRLLLIVLAGSLGATIVFGALQIAFDRRQDLARLRQRLAQIEPGYLDALAAAVWNDDAAQYGLLLRGIASQPDIVRVELRNVEGRRLYALGRSRDGDGLRVSYPLEILTREGAAVRLGVLAVTASIASIDQGRVREAAFLFLWQLLQTLLIAAVIVCAFTVLVTRHLGRIAEHARTLDLHRVRPLTLDRRPPRRPDELDGLVRALNGMQEELAGSYRRIHGLNQALDRKVRARTSHLQQAYQRLERQHEDLRQTQCALAKKQRDLEDAVRRDPLTGLYNRRKFHEVFAAMQRHHHRHGRCLALLMVDVDHFKAFNDSYGHQAGDRALEELAGILEDQVRRPLDLAFRFGGEEFLLLLAETNLRGAEAVAAQLLQALARRKIPHRDSPVAPHLTVSIGGAVGRTGPEDATDRFLGLADANLYRAKRAGRNRSRLTCLSASLT